MSEVKAENSIELHDIWAAFSLLTRLPVPVDHTRAGARGARAAWAFPIVGLVLGAIAGGVGAGLIALGVPVGPAAASALAVQVLMTGALHEDGLADTFDALFGGQTPKRRLEIMKDSRIGAYGATALGIALILRWSGAASLSGWDLVAGFAMIGAISRSAIVIMALALKPARRSGMSAGFGQPPTAAAFMATALSLLAAIGFASASGVLVLLAAFVALLPLYQAQRRLIGGQTGDGLGASQQVAEIAGYLVIAALWSV